MMHIDMIQHMLDAGLGDHRPAQHGQWLVRPRRTDCQPRCNGYTYLSETFLPKLRKAGVDEATIDKLTRENPFHAFARPS